MRTPRPGRVVALVGALTVIVAAVAYVVSRGDEDPLAVQLGGAAGAAFDQRGSLAPAIRRALFSPDGARLAVISDTGIGVARGGQVQLITPPGATAVDAAWMPNSAALVVAEGPAVISRLTVVALDGSTTGVATLDAPFSVGDGNGLAVDGRGGFAVAATETRDPVGGRRHHDLVIVDLTSGHVVPLTQTPGADETWPVFVDATHVLFARTTTGGRPTVVERDLTTGSERTLSAGDEAARPIGTLRTGEPVIAGGLPGKPITVWAVAINGRRIRLGQVGAGDTVWSVDPAGTRAVATRGSIVRAVTLQPPF